MVTPIIKLKGKHTTKRWGNGSKLPKNGKKYISNHAIQMPGGRDCRVYNSTCKSKIARVSSERRLGRIISSYLPISKPKEIN